jgi:hypothetical protein
MSIARARARSRLLAAGFGSLLLLDGLGCKATSHQSDGWGLRASETAERFSASDLSIFVPLKPFTASGPNDPFQIEGDGFCNAAPLSLGDADPILSRAIFDQMAKDAFGKVGAVRLDPALGTSVNQKTVDKINAALARAAAACGSAAVPADLATLDDERLLELSAHLALVKGVSPDPCLNKPEIAGFEERTSLPPECSISEARLVVQPFVRSHSGTVEAMDVTMHLIYALPDLQDLLADLRALQAVTRSTLEKSPWGSETDNAPRMLRPHPGLRAEMGCKAGSPRPVGETFFKLLTKHTATSRLKSIAFMTSTTAGGQWTFGTRQIDKGAVIPNTSYESFSLKQFSGGKAPFNIDKSIPVSILPLYTTKMSSAELQQFSGVVNDIVNPSKVSQVLETPGMSTTCTSCHLPEFTLAELGRRMSQPLFPGIRPYQRATLENERDTPAPPIWRPFKFVKAKNIQNLRNFGYGPAFAFGVSQRAINETDELLMILDKLEL